MIDEKQCIEMLNVAENKGYDRGVMTILLTMLTMMERDGMVGMRKFTYRLNSWLKYTPPARDCRILEGGEGGMRVCYCGKCEVEGYPLPKDFPKE